MKYQLPNKREEKGFTLIELMVVVAIIAILAVIGLTVFTGLQQKARDAKRQSDIQAISNALETNYDNSKGQYPEIATTYFVGGTVPVDPLSGQTRCEDSTNPTGGAACDYTITYTNTSGAQGPTTLDSSTKYPLSLAATSYTVCANLETSATPYCLSN